MAEPLARIDGLEANIRDHEARIRVLETDNTANKLNISELRRSMDKIESNTTWILRLVVGSIVAALLGLLFKGV